jgi:hypothetical protein
LKALTPTPSFPNNASIFDAVPSALGNQYPSVYGGVVVAPAKPGETQVEVNSHFIVLERVHDPALEAETKAAYQAPLTVAFELTPRTAQCLADISTSLKNHFNAISMAGISLAGYGTAAKQVDVDVTECKGRSAKSAVQWFSKHWGSAIEVKTCSKVATAGPLVNPSTGQALPSKVTSVTATLEPYNPQLTNQGIPAEEVAFTVSSVTGGFSCHIDVLRSGRLVGSTSASFGPPANNQSVQKESVSV